MNISYIRHSYPWAYDDVNQTTFENGLFTAMLAEIRGGFLGGRMGRSLNPPPPSKREREREKKSTFPKPLILLRFGK